MPTLRRRAAPSSVSSVPMSWRTLLASKSASKAPAWSPVIHFVAPMEESNARPAGVSRVPKRSCSSLDASSEARSSPTSRPPSPRGPMAAPTLESRVDLGGASPQSAPALRASWRPSCIIAMARSCKETSRNIQPTVSQMRAAGWPSSSPDAKSVRTWPSASSASQVCNRLATLALTWAAPGPSQTNLRTSSETSLSQALHSSTRTENKAFHAGPRPCPPSKRSAANLRPSTGGVRMVSSQTPEPSEAAR
mmetsp:Transcript_25031/g.77876  ORF Transcript_25031/g.77876 Transcript_25031/m.77876 type:complete len:250 (-) Transcript_25031:430-1179(-)